MTLHDETTSKGLEKHGERLWQFGFTYQLPLPEEVPDSRDRQEVIMIVNDVLHDSERPFGDSYVSRGNFEIVIREFGLYSAALRNAQHRATLALEAGSVSVSILVSIDYIHPDFPLDWSEEPPF